MHLSRRRQTTQRKQRQRRFNKGSASFLETKEDLDIFRHWKLRLQVNIYLRSTIGDQEIEIFLCDLKKKDFKKENEEIGKRDNR